MKTANKVEKRRVDEVKANQMLANKMDNLEGLINDNIKTVSRYINDERADVSPWIVSSWDSLMSIRIDMIRSYCFELRGLATAVYALGYGSHDGYLALFKSTTDWMNKAESLRERIIKVKSADVKREDDEDGKL